MTPTHLSMSHEGKETLTETCTIDGCGKKVHATKMCAGHYLRMKRHGDPLAGGTVKGEPMRFIEEVALKYEGDDCLLWPFGKVHGYGQIWLDGKHDGAHRYVCQQIHGDAPTPDHQAAHSCGNGHEGCVNPNHLSWKTRSQNNQDKIIHGTIARGERHGRSKLTEAEARTILNLNGLKPPREIAAAVGVDVRTVRSIHYRQSWAWL